MSCSSRLVGGTLLGEAEGFTFPTVKCGLRRRSRWSPDNVPGAVLSKPKESPVSRTLFREGEGILPFPQADGI